MTKAKLFTAEIVSPPGYDSMRMLEFFSPRAIKGVEIVTPKVYLRASAMQRGRTIVDVRVGTSTLKVSAAVPPDQGLRLTAKVKALFNVSTLSAAMQQLEKDPFLAKSLKSNRGLRVPGTWDPFEVGVRAILGQQVSVVGATTLAGRIAAKFGNAIRGHKSLTNVFPSAADLANADLSGLGLTTRRAATIVGFAGAVVKTPELLDQTKPLDRFVDDIVALSGFGPWTANYMAMRLGYEDAFPASDLGVRKALNTTSDKEVLRTAERWRPYRALATMHLWASLS